MANKPFADRFWDRVSKGASDDCWLWTGRKNRQGYGDMMINKVRTKVHRVAYEIQIGPIPEGLYVLHNCPNGDNPSCCNGRHLWVGTQRDNIRDMMAKGRGVFQNQRGESNPYAKLTADKVRTIRLRAASGQSPTSLSREFGVSLNTITMVVSRGTWSHIA